MRAKLCHDSIKNRSESVPAPKLDAVPVACPYTGAVSKMMADLSVTASQDSGINLSFSDSEGHRHEKWVQISNKSLSLIQILSNRARTISTDNESVDMDLSIKKPTQPPTIVYNPNFRRGSSILRSSPETDIDTEAGKWQNLPKEIWKQAAEVND